MSRGTRLIMEPRLELKEFGCTAAERCENSHFAFLHSHLHFSPPSLFKFHLFIEEGDPGHRPCLLTSNTTGFLQASTRPCLSGHTLISHCCEAAQGSLNLHDCQPWAPGGLPWNSPETAHPSCRP